jgi:heme/copper-type cytochrome/quinol oxidase subunit 2
MKTPVKAGRSALLSAVLLVLLAGPASGAMPVVAEAKPWHYWLAPVLTLSFVGLLIMLVVGYVVKVVMLKYGVKVGRKSS